MPQRPRQTHLIGAHRALRATLFSLGAGALVGAPARADDATLTQLLQAADDAGRASSSHATVSMEVKTKRYARTLKMEMWSQGTERTLIRVLEPAKDAGVSTLMVDDNLWNYLPNIDRTMKVPTGMMSGAWMGSHLSNDDLVRDSRFSEDYDCTLTAGLAAEPAGEYIVSCAPHEDTPVVWSRVELHLREDRVPIAEHFYDEDGERVRSMLFEDIQVIDGQPTAMTMRVLPLDKEGEYTLFRYLQLQLNLDLPARLFSLQSLKR